MLSSYNYIVQFYCTTIYYIAQHPTTKVWKSVPSLLMKWDVCVRQKNEINFFKLCHGAWNLQHTMFNNKNTTHQMKTIKSLTSGKKWMESIISVEPSVLANCSNLSWCCCQMFKRNFFLSCEDANSCSLSLFINNHSLKLY